MASKSFTNINRSKIIDRAKPESNQHSRAYFYCNYKEAGRRNPASILRSLVKQLCQGSPEGNFPQPVLSIYEKRKNDGNLKSFLSVEECKKLLIKLSSGFLRTTILIDALDECDKDTREVLFDVLENLVSDSSPEHYPIKVFVTSRDDGDLQRRLGNSPNIYIQERDNSADINLYITSEVESCITKSRLLDGKVDDDLKEHIIDVLRNGAHGM